MVFSDLSQQALNNIHNAPTVSTGDYDLTILYYNTGFEGTCPETDTRLSPNNELRVK